MNIFWWFIWWFMSALWQTLSIKVYLVKQFQSRVYYDIASFLCLFYFLFLSKKNNIFTVYTLKCIKIFSNKGHAIDIEGLILAWPKFVKYLKSTREQPPFCGREVLNDEKFTCYYINSISATI